MIVDCGPLDERVSFRIVFLSSLPEAVAASEPLAPADGFMLREERRFLRWKRVKLFLFLNT